MKIIALAIALAAADQSQAFDLVCKGEVSTRSILGDKIEPYEMRYRVDLVSGQWCDGDCRKVSAIEKIDPGSIQFASIDRDGPTERERKGEVVSRDTGEHKVIYTHSYRGRPESILVMRWQGTCEPAEFSGFPTSGKKF